jgi:hypothetical protein
MECRNEASHVMEWDMEFLKHIISLIPIDIIGIREYYIS